METEAAVDSFEYENVAGRVAFGRGAVGQLDSMVADLDADRVLLVCGESVGANEGTVGPIEGSLGDVLVGTFDGTTPAKKAKEVFAGLDRVDETDADALVAVGGGSSIDVARAICGLHSKGSYEDVRAHAAETGALPVGETSLPLLAVPTTLAGADLSTVGSVTFDGSDGNDDNDGNEPVSAGYSEPTLMPDGLVYDPDLFETTPASVLVGSAMNGFDKGLELPYSRHANPLTDAPALYGLSLLAPALSHLREAAAGEKPAAMDRIVAGIVCVQYGRATTGDGMLSVVHAYGHGLRAEGIQQGMAHAVMAPPVLESLFEAVDGRREALADALGTGEDGNSDDADLAAGVVERVRAVRDGMGLPARLRDLDGLERAALSRVAGVVANDSFLANGPEDFDPSREEIEEVLDDAW